MHKLRMLEWREVIVFVQYVNTVSVVLFVSVAALCCVCNGVKLFL